MNRFRSKFADAASGTPALDLGLPGPADVCLFPEVGVDRGATFSPSGDYRYTLWRRWNRERPICCWVMLNPSKADAERNDPTLERVERRTKRWGFGGVTVVNLFAFRATDPREMLAADDPVGPENDQAILLEANRAGRVVCAWGNHGKHRGRSAEVVTMLREQGIPLWALGFSRMTGEPGHPLYVPYSMTGVLWPETAP